MSWLPLDSPSKTVLYSALPSSSGLNLTEFLRFEVFVFLRVCFFVINRVETRPFGVPLTPLDEFLDGARDGRDEGVQKSQIAGVIRRFVVGGRRGKEVVKEKVTKKGNRKK